MSAFSSYKSTTQSKPSGKSKAAAAAEPPILKRLRSAGSLIESASSQSSGDGLEHLMPKDEDDLKPTKHTSSGLAPIFKQASLNPHKKVKEPNDFVKTEDHDYITDNCLVPSEQLRSFGEVVGARSARIFAEQYEPISTGAKRTISGLLFFGPSDFDQVTVEKCVKFDKQHGWHLT